MRERTKDGLDATSQRRRVVTRDLLSTPPSDSLYSPISLLLPSVWQMLGSLPTRQRTLANCAAFASGSGVLRTRTSLDFPASHLLRPYFQAVTTCSTSISTHVSLIYLYMIAVLITIQIKKDNTRSKSCALPRDLYRGLAICANLKLGWPGPRAQRIPSRALTARCYVSIHLMCEQSKLADTICLDH